jgi:mannose-6-phosphate isomerase class I
MRKLHGIVDQELHRTGGVLRLRPTCVRRWYRDGGRLGLAGKKPGATLIQRENLWVPERWIASTCIAKNVFPRKNEGLSIVDIPGQEFPLKDALAAHPEILLGSAYAKAHDNEFRVLTKILDGYEPIVMHLHATDAQLKKHPAWFKGHRFGKTEAYYFLEAPKGVYPYTHFGLHPGATANDLLAAIEKGRDHVMDLSPVFHQRFGTGFFTPAGMPHSPGTALTLEIQQPSDVYTLLENCPVFGGEPFSAQQQHPGIPSLGDAMRLVDFKAATQKNVLDKHFIEPELVRRGNGTEEHWICPPRFTEKFSGKRLRIAPGKSDECQERGPYAVLVWRGQGRVARHDFRAERGWDECFVSAPLAVSGHRYENTGQTPLELFKIFAMGVN